jgi:hypothetical protein
MTLERLGTPDASGYITEFGVDFIPFVHCSFTSMGEPRGRSAIAHAVSKIQEGDRQATRLHEIAYRNGKALWGLMSDIKDKNGKAIAPSLNKTTPIEFKENSIINLPMGQELRPLIQDVKYADLLAILNAQIDETEKDLPECRYFDLDATNMSGIALRTLMAPAIDRALEGQSSIIAGLKRVDEIALTLGSVNQLPGFMGIGSYEAGDFEHEFQNLDIIPLSMNEKLVLLQNSATKLPLKTALRITGFDQQFIDTAMLELAEEKAQEAAININASNAGWGGLNASIIQ